MSKEVVDGYVKNESDRSVFKLQRTLYPGSKLNFADAFLSVGEKSGVEGEEFVKWLRENIFPGPDWGFYRGNGKPFFSSRAKSKQDVAPETPAPADSPAKGAGRNMRRKAQRSTRENKKSITPAQLVEPEYSQAKVLIDKCNDKKVLKRALTLSRNLANRGDHMRHLMKRLEQVY